MKRFSLVEANALIPEVSRRLHAAHAELGRLEWTLNEANDDLLACEWRVRQARTQGAPPLAMSELQAAWDEAAAHLVATKQHLEERQAAWKRAINRSGPILRDMRTGKVDFMAHEGDSDTCYCWQLGEPEIAFWHPRDHVSPADRRPLNERA